MNNFESSIVMEWGAEGMDVEARLVGADGHPGDLTGLVWGGEAQDWSKLKLWTHTAAMSEVQFHPTQSDHLFTYSDPWENKFDQILRLWKSAKFQRPQNPHQPDLEEVPRPESSSIIMTRPRPEASSIIISKPMLEPSSIIMTTPEASPIIMTRPEASSIIMTRPEAPSEDLPQEVVAKYVGIWYNAKVLKQVADGAVVIFPGYENVSFVENQDILTHAYLIPVNELLDTGIQVDLGLNQEPEDVFLSTDDVFLSQGITEEILDVSEDPEDDNPPEDDKHLKEKNCYVTKEVSGYLLGKGCHNLREYIVNHIKRNNGSAKITT